MNEEQVSAKLDAMKDHPYIQELRSIFCNVLIFYLTEGFVQFERKRNPGRG